MLLHYENKNFLYVKNKKKVSNKKDPMHPIHLVFALLVVLVWGFNFVVIQVGLQELPPLVLGFARFFLTSIPAVFFVKFPSTSIQKVVLYGLTMFAIQFALLFVGMFEGVPPGLAALLVQTQVFFSILLAILFLNAHVNLWQGLGALIAFSGIAFLAMHTGNNLTFAGLILVIASAASWAVGNLISKKIGKVNMLSLVIWGSLIAWPPLLIASWLFYGFDCILFSLSHLTWLSMGSVLYIAYLSTLFGYGMWSLLLHHYNLPTVSPFSLLVPIIAIGSSVLVLGEPLQTWKIIAAVLVITGLCINLLTKATKSRS